MSRHLGVVRRASAITAEGESHQQGCVQSRTFPRRPWQNPSRRVRQNSLQMFGVLRVSRKDVSQLPDPHLRARRPTVSPEWGYLNGTWWVSELTPSNTALGAPKFVTLDAQLAMTGLDRWRVSIPSTSAAPYPRKKASGFSRFHPRKLIVVSVVAH